MRLLDEGSEPARRAYAVHRYLRVRYSYCTIPYGMYRRGRAARRTVPPRVPEQHNDRRPGGGDVISGDEGRRCLLMEKGCCLLHGAYSMGRRPMQCAPVEL